MGDISPFPILFVLLPAKSSRNVWIEYISASVSIDFHYYFLSWATKRLFPTMFNFISASNSKFWLLGGELGDRCVGFDSNKMEQNACFLEIFIWFQKITIVKFMRSKNYLMIHMFRSTFTTIFSVCRLITQVAAISCYMEISG